MAQSKYRYPEFSGAIQQKSNPHIKKPNEIRDGGNIDFGAQIGSMRRRLGAQHDDGDYDLPELPVDKNTLGAYIARFPTANEIWAASNAADDLTAVLRRWTGPNADDWTDVRTGMIADSEIYMQDDLDEVWVSSYDKANDVIGIPFTVDATHDVSTSRHLQFAPHGKFYIPFGGAMWAANVSVGGTRYRDRLYKSSGPTGAISYARSPQTDIEADTVLVDQVPAMTSNTTPTGVVSASNEVGYPAWHAFDDSLLTEWSTVGTAGAGWLRFDFGASN